MAFSFSGLNAWVDEHSEATRFFTESLMSNDVVPWVQSNGQLLTGVKGDKIKLPTLGATTAMQDGDDCTFDDSGNVTIGQYEVNMKNIKFQQILCARPLEDYFTAVTLPQGQHYTGLGSAENAILAEIKAEIAQTLGIAYWRESTLFKGFLPLIQQTVTPVGTATPTSGGVDGTDAEGVFNIVETLSAAYLSAPATAQAMLRGDYSVVMSPQDVHNYFHNLIKLNGETAFVQSQLSALSNGAQSFTHMGTGVQINVQAALTGSGSIIISRKKNLTLAFDLESDANTMKMGTDQYQENIWYTVRLKVGTGLASDSAANVKYWGPAS